jgi:hypothetical protein
MDTTYQRPKIKRQKSPWGTIKSLLIGGCLSAVIAQSVLLRKGWAGEPWPEVITIIAGLLCGCLLMASPMEFTDTSDYRLVARFRSHRLLPWTWWKILMLNSFLPDVLVLLAVRIVELASGAAPLDSLLVLWELFVALFWLAACLTDSVTKVANVWLTPEGMQFGVLHYYRFATLDRVYSGRSLITLYTKPNPRFPATNMIFDEDDQQRAVVDALKEHDVPLTEERTDSFGNQALSLIVLAIVTAFAVFLIGLDWLWPYKVLAVIGLSILIKLAEERLHGTLAVERNKLQIEGTDALS